MASTRRLANGRKATSGAAQDGFSLPANKQNFVALWLLAMSEATKKPVYRQRAEQWWRLMKSRMRLRDDGKYFVWNYWDPAGPWDYKPDGSPKHWVGVHPNGGYYAIDVEGIVMAYEHSLVFRKEDLKRLVATNRDFMWNRQIQGAKFQRIDGSKPDPRWKNSPGVLWTRSCLTTIRCGRYSRPTTSRIVGAAWRRPRGTSHCIRSGNANDGISQLCSCPSFPRPGEPASQRRFPTRAGRMDGQTSLNRFQAHCKWAMSDKMGCDCDSAKSGKKQARRAMMAAWTVLCGLVLGSVPPVGEAIDVAPVWSGHPVNFSLLTAGKRQFVAFYDAQRQMTVAWRNVDGAQWQFVRLASTLRWDSHNYVTLAADDAGCLHLSGNMHCVPLVYFRTEIPYDPASFPRCPAWSAQ